MRGKISAEKFDTKKWKSADLNSENNWSIRWDMMNSLRSNYELIGMSEKEIIKLLGKPSENDYDANTFSYYLGYTHTGINTGTLTFNFENGIVESFSFWQGIN